MLKEKALRNVSMSVVNEREERALAVREVKKLRSENLSLKRETVLINKEKIRLQNLLKTTQQRKDALESKILEAESLMKEKAMALYKKAIGIDRDNADTYYNLRSTPSFLGAA